MSHSQFNDIFITKQVLKELMQEIAVQSNVIGEPIEILVNLAKNGEIDPWNIDIVEVTDKFLQQLQEMEKMDLRISGRTLLYAAILLRMKSNALVEPEKPDYVVDDFDFFDVEDYPVPEMPLRRQSNRPVTLEELINELKKVELYERKKIERTPKRPERRSTIEDVINIAHEEDLEKRVLNISKTLKEILKNRNFISFTEFVKEKNKIMTYISLLFLATKKEIWLEQEELFGELYIRARNNNNEV